MHEDGGASVEIARTRELIERMVRPGQRGGSLTVDRLPRAAVLQPQGHASGTRCDWQAGQTVTYAVYGRGRYGGGRYASG